LAFVDISIFILVISAKFVTIMWRAKFIGKTHTFTVSVRQDRPITHVWTFAGIYC